MIPKAALTKRREISMRLDKMFVSLNRVTSNKLTRWIKNYKEQTAGLLKKNRKEKTPAHIGPFLGPFHNG